MGIQLVHSRVALWGEGVRGCRATGAGAGGGAWGQGNTHTNTTYNTTKHTHPATKLPLPPALTCVLSMSSYEKR